MDSRYLKKQAAQIRKSILTAVYYAKSGHPGGSLSAADLFTYLYFEEMNLEPRRTGSFCTVKGACGSGIVRGPGPQRIFSGGRS